MQSSPTLRPHPTSCQYIHQTAHRHNKFHTNTNRISQRTTDCHDHRHQHRSPEPHRHTYTERNQLKCSSRKARRTSHSSKAPKRIDVQNHRNCTTPREAHRSEKPALGRTFRFMHALHRVQSRRQRKADQGNLKLIKVDSIRETSILVTSISLFHFKSLVNAKRRGNIFERYCQSYYCTCKSFLGGCLVERTLSLMIGVWTLMT